MKIVFLDFDGVLVHSKCRRLPGELCITTADRSCAGRLIELLKLTDAKVVLETTWCYLHDEPYLKNWLRKYGLVDSMFHEDFTAKDPESCVIDGARIQMLDKARGIRAWLARHPEVSNYIVLEDENPFNLDAPERDRVVYIPGGWFNKGFQDSHEQLAIKLLTDGPKRVIIKNTTH